MFNFYYFTQNVYFFAMICICFNGFLMSTTYKKYTLIQFHSVVWHPPLPLVNRCNNSEAATFPIPAMLPWDFHFFQICFIIIDKISCKMYGNEWLKRLYCLLYYTAVKPCRLWCTFYDTCYWSQYKFVNLQICKYVCCNIKTNTYYKKHKSLATIWKHRLKHRCNLISMNA